MAIKGPGARTRASTVKIMDSEQGANGGLIVASGFPITNKRRQKRPENINLRDESTMTLPVPYQKSTGFTG